MNEPLLFKIILVYGLSFAIGALACLVGIFIGEEYLPKVNRWVVRIIWLSVMAMFATGTFGIMAAMAHYI